MAMVLIATVACKDIKKKLLCSEYNGSQALTTRLFYYIFCKFLLEDIVTSQRSFYLKKTYCYLKCSCYSLKNLAATTLHKIEFS